MAKRFLKDPNAVIDFQWQWSQWLKAGDYLTSAVIPNPPSGITITNFEYDTTSATMRLSGGTAGKGYPFVCHITTFQGREDDRTIYIICEQR